MCRILYCVHFKTRVFCINLPLTIDIDVDGLSIVFKFIGAHRVQTLGGARITRGTRGSSVVLRCRDAHWVQMLGVLKSHPLQGTTTEYMSTYQFDFKFV